MLTQSLVVSINRLLQVVCFAKFLACACIIFASVHNYTQEFHSCESYIKENAVNNTATARDILGAARAEYQQVEAARQLAKSAEESARNKLFELTTSLGDELKDKLVVVSGTSHMRQCFYPSLSRYSPTFTQTKLVDKRAYVLRGRIADGATRDDEAEPSIEFVFEKHKLESRDGGWFVVRLSAITKLEIVETEAPQS